MTPLQANSQDHDIGLPVNDDFLWPPDKLLQIQRLNPGEIKRLSLRPRDYVLVLTRDEFTVAEMLAKEPKLLIYVSDEPQLYEFYAGPTKVISSFRTRDFTRVVVSTSLLHNFVSIWVRTPGTRARKVLCLETFAGIPRTISDLVNEGIRKGILGSDRRVGLRAVFVREIERQFRRAAPQADIILRGQQLSEETFRKLVQGQTMRVDSTLDNKA